MWKKEYSWHHKMCKDVLYQEMSQVLCQLILKKSKKNGLLQFEHNN